MQNEKEKRGKKKRLNNIIKQKYDTHTNWSSYCSFGSFFLSFFRPVSLSSPMNIFSELYSCTIMHGSTWYTLLFAFFSSSKFGIKSDRMDLTLDELFFYLFGAYYFVCTGFGVAFVFMILWHFCDTKCGQFSLPFTKACYQHNPCIWFRLLKFNFQFHHHCLALLSSFCELLTILTHFANSKNDMISAWFFCSVFFSSFFWNSPTCALHKKM